MENNKVADDIGDEVDWEIQRFDPDLLLDLDYEGNKLKSLIL